MTDQPTPTPPSPAPAPSPSPAPAPSPDASVRTVTTERPAYLPETFWNPEKGEANVEALKTVFETHAEREARLAALPKEAAGYKFGVPKDYKTPDGWALDDKHPLVGPFREWAFKHQLTQEQFESAVQMFGEHQVADSKAYNEFAAGERQKLGANGENRVTALKTWLGGVLKDSAHADAIIKRMVLASDIQMLEKLQLAFIGQGGSDFNNNGRDPTPPPPPPQSNVERWGSALYGKPNGKV